MAPVISNQEVRPNTWMLHLDAPAIAAEARPGQFVHVLCDGDTAHLLRRPLSIYRTTRDGEIVLFFQVFGSGTACLAGRQKGDEVDIIGPLGKGFDVLPESRHLLLLAGGMGIAALTALADEALTQGKEVALLAGFRAARQVTPAEFLPQGINYVTITEDGSSGTQGLVIDLIPNWITWADQVFACGPKRMLRRIALMDWPDRVSPSIQVSMEENMACGVGVCLGCAVETKQGFKMVCGDGPVFYLEQIKWA